MSSAGGKARSEVRAAPADYASSESGSTAKASDDAGEQLQRRDNSLIGHLAIRLRRASLAHNVMAEPRISIAQKSISTSPRRSSLLSMGSALGITPYTAMPGQAQSLISKTETRFDSNGSTETRFDSNGSDQDDATAPLEARSLTPRPPRRISLEVAKNTHAVRGQKQIGEGEALLASSRMRALEENSRRASCSKSHRIWFDSTVPKPSTGGRCVDDLAIARSDREWGHNAGKRENAILNHKDSVLLVAHSILPALQGQSPPPTPASKCSEKEPRRQKSAGQPTPAQQFIAKPSLGSGRAFRSVPVFAQCTEQFLALLAAGANHKQLKPGEVRSIVMTRTSGTRARPGVAVVVESGSCRIEMGQALVDECGIGSTFGLADVMAGVSLGAAHECGADSKGTAELVVRAAKEGCRCFFFHTTALRRALNQCPQDHARLGAVLRMLSQQEVAPGKPRSGGRAVTFVGSTRQFLTALQCSETAKAPISHSTTRHLFTPREFVCCAGCRSPDGLILIRSGVLGLEIDGVEVRRVSAGHIIGEEMLFRVCHKWAVTARCITHCDVQILHRRRFTALVKDMQTTSEDQKRESARLLFLLEGQWKEDKVILTWPLFRGYDQDFLQSLARLIETRVVLMGRLLVECGAGGVGESEGREVALYFLLHGTCEEVGRVERPSRKDVQGHGQDNVRVGRNLAPGACIGVREFLGVQEVSNVTVTARTLCLVAVLHRNVFLRALDNDCHHAHQSLEVTRLLDEELDRSDPPIKHARVWLIATLPLLRGCDKSFVELVCSKATRRCCFIGQNLCQSNVVTSTMFVLARGDIGMTIADLEIKRIVPGGVINLLSLCNEPFTPAETVTCKTTSELWALTRADFEAAIKDYPNEKGRLAMLLKARLLQLGPNAVEDPSDVPPSQQVASKEGVAKDGPVVHLSNIAIFTGCSHAFLNWIQAHLETTICFQDQVVVREGARDSCLYIVCHGTLITEGSAAQQAQKSVGSGGVLGTLELLGIEEEAQATATAVEITTLQILHAPIFRKALERFPENVSHFDTVTLAKLRDRSEFVISSVPFFDGCDPDFCRQLERHLCMRLVHKGCVIIEEGSDGEKLCILSEGSAIAEDSVESPSQQQELISGVHKPQRISRLATLNANVALGLANHATSTIRAVELCVVAVIEASPFLTVLQRFPNEVTRLASLATGGRLWPLEAETVPMFCGASTNFFNNLISVSEWRMYLPSICVVKEGGVGDILFLLCYGVAVQQVSGVQVGNLLIPGDCVGKQNVLRLSTKYAADLRTQTVCHFRMLVAAQLAQLLHEHPAECRRFEQLKHQVQQEACEEERLAQACVTREKLRERIDGAFRAHVANVRDARAFASQSSATSSVLPVEVSKTRFSEALEGLSRRRRSSDMVIPPDEDDTTPSSSGMAGREPSSGLEEHAPRRASQLHARRQSALNLAQPDAPQHTCNKSTLARRMEESKALRLKLNRGEHVARDGPRKKSLWFPRLEEQSEDSDSSLSESSVRLEPALSDGPKARKAVSGGRVEAKAASLRLSSARLSKRPGQKAQGVTCPRHMWLFDGDGEPANPSRVNINDIVELEDHGIGQADPEITKAAATVGLGYVDPALVGGGKTIEQIFFAEMKDMTTTKVISSSKRVEAAIHCFAGARRDAILRGKILRLLHNDLSTDDEDGGVCMFSQEHLEELSRIFPPKVGSSSTSLAIPHDGHEDKPQFDRSLAPTAAAKSRQSSRAPTTQQALRRKFRELTCRPVRLPETSAQWPSHA